MRAGGGESAPIKKDENSHSPVGEYVAQTSFFIKIITLV